MAIQNRRLFILSHLYSEPAIGKLEFNCPRCGVRASQAWQNTYCRPLDEGRTPTRLTHIWIDEFLENKKNEKIGGPSGEVIAYWRRIAEQDVFNADDWDSINAKLINNLSAARCAHCKNLSVWINNDMVFPHGGEVPAHEDMPEDVKTTFSEAAKILSASPRASAALSRLALQQLCVALGCQKKTLDEKIGELVAKGLSKEIEMMLDSVRVIGNNAVHPGEIDLRDGHDTARFLLECMNRICQRLITEKREVEDLYEMLPEGARSAIERRNAKLLPPPGSENAGVE